jgi:hypothetical protein
MTKLKSWRDVLPTHPAAELFPQADKRRLEIENIGLRSEVEETKAVRKPEGEGEGEGIELGNLLRAWDRASQGAREKFKARVGLVAVEPPAKVRR